MIYKTDDGAFVISSHQVWLPGCFESERAAKYAFRFSNEELQELQNAACEKHPKRVITFNDLQVKRQSR